MKFLVIQDNEPIGINLQSTRNGTGAYINQIYPSNSISTDQPRNNAAIGNLMISINGQDVSSESLECITSKISLSPRPLVIGFQAPELDNDIEEIFSDARKLRWLLEYFLAQNRPECVDEICLANAFYHLVWMAQSVPIDDCHDSKVLDILICASNTLSASRFQVVISRSNQISESAKSIEMIRKQGLPVDVVEIISAIQLLYRRLYSIVINCFNEFTETMHAQRMAAYYSSDRGLQLHYCSFAAMMTNPATRLWMYLYAANINWHSEFMAYAKYMDDQESKRLASDRSIGSDDNDETRILGWKLQTEFYPMFQQSTPYSLLLNESLPTLNKTYALARLQSPLVDTHSPMKESHWQSPKLTRSPMILEGAQKDLVQPMLNDSAIQRLLRIYPLPDRIHIHRRPCAVQESEVSSATWVSTFNTRGVHAPCAKSIVELPISLTSVPMMIKIDPDNCSSIAVLPAPIETPMFEDAIKMFLPIKTQTSALSNQPPTSILYNFVATKPDNTHIYGCAYVTHTFRQQCDMSLVRRQEKRDWETPDQYFHDDHTVPIVKIREFDHSIEPTSTGISWGSMALPNLRQIQTSVIRGLGSTLSAVAAEFIQPRTTITTTSSKDTDPSPTPFLSSESTNNSCSTSDSCPNITCDELSDSENDDDTYSEQKAKDALVAKLGYNSNWIEMQDMSKSRRVGSTSCNVGRSINVDPIDNMSSIYPGEARYSENLNISGIMALTPKPTISSLRKLVRHIANLIDSTQDSQEFSPLESKLLEANDTILPLIEGRRHRSQDVVMNIEFKLVQPLLTARILLALWLGLILESKILFIFQTRCTACTMLGELLRRLMQPMRWFHVYAPLILSPSGTKLLDCPTPFLIGLQSDYLMGTTVPSDIIVFDLNKLTLVLPNDIEEFLHNNPLLQDFERILCPQLRDCDDIDIFHDGDKSLSVQEKDEVDAIAETTRLFINRILYEAQKCCLRGDCDAEHIVLLDGPRFVEQASETISPNWPHSKQFYDKIMKTRAFSSLLLDPFDR